jgi:hypothetical protein
VADAPGTIIIANIENTDRMIWEPAYAEQRLLVLRPTRKDHGIACTRAEDLFKSKVWKKAGGGGRSFQG